MTAFLYLFFTESIFLLKTVEDYNGDSHSISTCPLLLLWLRQKFRTLNMFRAYLFYTCTVFHTYATFFTVSKKIHTHGNYQCFKQDFYGNFLRCYIHQSRREMVYARALYPLHPFTRTFIIYGNWQPSFVFLYTSLILCGVNRVLTLNGIFNTAGKAKTCRVIPPN